MLTTVRVQGSHVFVNDGSRQRDYTILPVLRRGKPVPVVVDTEYYNKFDSHEWVFSDGRVCDAQTRRGVAELIMEGPVEHIDQAPTDLRFENLRRVVQPVDDDKDLMTEDADDDDNEIMSELRAIGISALPAHVCYDDEEERFTFEGHPYQQQVATAVTHGTRATRRTTAEKLASCLKRYTAMHEKHAGPAVDPDEAALHKRLAASFNAIVRYAHIVAPATFPSPAPLAPPRRMSPDYTLAKDIIAAIADHVASDPVAGAAQPVPHGPGAYAVVRAGKRTIFDSRHAPVLRDLTWDAEDLRVNVSPALVEAHPSIAQLFPGARKVPLPAFIYHVLEGQPVLPGRTLVPFNNVRGDVRASNLMYVEGEAKLHKAPVSLAPPQGVDIGMRYLPRGVAVGRDRKKMVFIIKPAMKRVAFKRDDARRVFEANVLPLLREADPNFDALNTRYQAMVEDAVTE
jgi:hypothetical protein